MWDPHRLSVRHYDVVVTTTSSTSWFKVDLYGVTNSHLAGISVLHGEVLNCTALHSCTVNNSAVQLIKLQWSNLHCSPVGYAALQEQWFLVSSVSLSKETTGIASKCVVTGIILHTVLHVRCYERWPRVVGFLHQSACHLSPHTLWISGLRVHNLGDIAVENKVAFLADWFCADLLLKRFWTKRGNDMTRHTFVVLAYFVGVQIWVTLFWHDDTYSNLIFFFTFGQSEAAVALVGAPVVKQHRRREVQRIGRYIVDWIAQLEVNSMDCFYIICFKHDFYVCVLFCNGSMTF